MPHKNYSGNDYYCDVAVKKLAPLDIEYESKDVLAFHHTSPYSKVHIVVVPKKHIDSFTTLSEAEQPILLEIMDVLKKLSGEVEKEHGAARILTNLGNYQDSKHLHFHIAFGEPLK